MLLAMVGLWFQGYRVKGMASASLHAFGLASDARHINYHNTGWGIMIFATWRQQVLGMSCLVQVQKDTAKSSHELQSKLLREVI